jgi:hypothetical protein
MVHAAIFCPFNREDATSLKWWALNIYFWGGGELQHIYAACLLLSFRAQGMHHVSE